VLSLEPTPYERRGYVNSSGASSWGARPVFSGGRWELFVAQMVNGCALQSWANNSAVVRAVSAGVDVGGPYAYLETVLPPFASNPNLYEVPPSDGGGWIIFGIGGALWTPVPETGCARLGGKPSKAPRGLAVSSLGPTPDSPSSPTEDGCGLLPLNNGCGVVVSHAASLEGPWTTTPVIFVNQNASALLDCTHTNPSIVYRRDGLGLRMAFNAGYCHNQLETIGIATAPSWRGPWSLASDAPIFLNASGVPHQCEDPMLWETARGWHLMVHNQAGAAVARYAHSLDGLSWVLHDDNGTNPGPYTGTILYTDGSVAHSDVERPELVFDPHTGQPTHLVNGAFDGVLGNGTSFTLVRPLKRA
jgi:hypothetical protein